MKRHDIERIDYDVYVINEQEAGDYVLYSDVAPLVEALRSLKTLLRSPSARDLAAAFSITKEVLTTIDAQERGV